MDAVQELARQDLDFDIKFDVRGGLAVQQKGILQPNDFDISDQWFHSIDLLCAAGSIQPIQIDQIELWYEIGNLTNTGLLTSTAKLGAGNRPMDVQYVSKESVHIYTPRSKVQVSPPNYR